MRAWQVRGHGAPREALSLVTVALPEPGPGELRLRVRAAAVGLPDAFMCRGTYPLTPRLPFVPGQEVCGVVDAVGPGVQVALGTRLMGVTSFMDGHGGFADATIARIDTLHRVPATMSDTQAAGFRIGLSTAWIALVRRGAVRADEWLAVLGAAGGSGTAALQLAHALGLRTIAVAAGEKKVELCRRIGADVTIDRTQQDVAAAILEATSGRGADVIYDPVGGEPAANALRGVAQGGRLLAVGFASGQWVRVKTADAVRRNMSLVGVYASGYTDEENRADHEALLALADTGALGGYNTVVPFDALPDAVESVAAGTVLGKLVVQIAAATNT